MGVTLTVIKEYDLAKPNDYDDYRRGEGEENKGNKRLQNCRRKIIKQDLRL